MTFKADETAPRPRNAVRHVTSLSSLSEYVPIQRPILPIAMAESAGLTTCNGRNIEPLILVKAACGGKHSSCKYPLRNHPVRAAGQRIRHAQDIGSDLILLRSYQAANITIGIGRSEEHLHGRKCWQRRCLSKPNRIKLFRPRNAHEVPSEAPDAWVLGQYKNKQDWKRFSEWLFICCEKQVDSSLNANLQTL